jgi:hypothetical protein
MANVERFEKQRVVPELSRAALPSRLSKEPPRGSHVLESLGQLNHPGARLGFIEFPINVGLFRGPFEYTKTSLRINSMM